jgi:uncharacterized protein
MTDYFLDSSAVLKRYMNEAGSNWIRLLVVNDDTGTLFISQLTLVEVAAAIAANARAPGGISERYQERILKRFLK